MTSPDRFYGGDASDLGTVRLLPQTSFSDLVKQVLNIPIVLNVTREEYNALDKKARHRAKRVPYLVPCTFAEPTSKRHADLAAAIALICIDIDDANAARPYYTSPATLAEQLRGLNWALYATASSTPAEPRVRLMVHAHGVAPSSYATLVNHVARMIGLAKVTTESYTVHQPMYRPTLFKGETAEELHPLLFSVTDGRPLSHVDVLLALGQEPSEDEKLLGDEPATPPPSGGNIDDDLEHLRATVDEVGIADVQSALRHVDPDLNYPEWLEVAAAMRHQFQRDPLAAAAYALFDEWSSKGTKYAGAEDTLAKWRSLKPQPKGRAPVTIRSLLKKASEQGWDASPLRAKCFAATLRWLRECKAETSVLMSAGLEKIATTPLVSTSEEEALLQELTSLVRKGGIKASIGSLRKDLRRHRIENAAEKRGGKAEKVPTWARGLCYASSPNEFIRPSTGERFSPEALDRAYGSRLLPSDEQLKEQGDESLGAKARPLLRPQDYLLNIVKVPVVYDTIYDPRSPNDIFITQEGRVYVNTYVRNYPEPDEAKADYAGMVFMEHMENLIGEAEYRRTLVDFLAYIVQNPGYKVRWAVLIQGAHGCGKTFLSEMMKIVLGRGHVKPVDSITIGGTFNEWAYGSQLVVLEEVRVVGQNRHDVMNRLKPLISNDLISINQKFRDTRMLENRTNYLLFSNHHDALALTAGDRRYFVLKSPLQTKAQVEALGEDYFVRLFGMLRDYGAGLRYFLENHKISETFRPDGHAPATKYLYQLITDTASEVTALVRDLVGDSTHPLVKHDLLSSATLMQMIEVAGLPKVSAQHLAHVLRDEGYITAGRHQIGEDRHPLWFRADSGIVIGEVKALAEKRVAAGKDTEGLL